MPRRLIEETSPLQKVSADSKHEKRVSYGLIPSLHTWPARRPLAACRAVTIATLLPDPADAQEKMKAEYTRLAGSPLPEKQRDYLCNTLIALILNLCCVFKKPQKFSQHFATLKVFRLTLADDLC